ncbi:MAG: DUF1109 domain-containing protein [Phenylobacterium sp.]|nr:DUF1109 domain-containing protein [Phenylobacterium sp.]
MQTETLIAQLAGQVTVAPPHAATRRLCVTLMIGSMVAFGMLLVGLGLRPDIAQATHTAPFWMKWMFTLSLVWASVVVVRRLGDPDGRVGLAGWGLIAPVAIVAMMAAGELMAAPESARAHMVLGRSFMQCFVTIPILAVPVFLGLLAAFQRLAPVRLRLAGAAAGFLAGAAAASVYALACPENTAAFMVTWYTAGMAVSALVGAALGPRLLRW